MYKLNIGSGYKRYDGFLNIDSFAGCEPDYLCDIEKDKLPFEDNTVDEIYCHHILEHLGEGFFHAIQEMYRVCCDGAIIDIKVPHPRHDTFLIDPTHRRPIYPYTIDMFSHKRNIADKENGGSETPIGLIYGVNLEVLNYDYVLDSYYQQMFQTIPDEQCDYIARSQNNVILEIIMKVMVIK
jgi:hypothetical protein